MNHNHPRAPEVFEPFSATKLSEFLSLHPVTAAGRQYIETSLAVPARNVAGTKVNKITDVPCPKMRGNAQAESGHVEYPFTLSYVFDLNVLGYANQPKRLELVYRGRNNRLVRAPYTPDCLRFDWHEGAVLEEWKPASERADLEEKFPGKYQRQEQGGYTSEPISNLVNPWGIRFIVRFSDEITQIAHSNRVFLHSYLHPMAANHYKAALAGVYKCFEHQSSLRYSDLAEQCQNLDAINWALATGRLHFDHNCGLLEREPGQILIFRHAQGLAAWHLAVRPDGSRPQIAGDFDPQQALEPTDAFLIDGVRLVVSLVGATAIHGIDEKGNYVVIPNAQLIAAHRAGTLVLPTKETRNEASRPFWRASPEALVRAVSRLEILEKLDRGDELERQERYSDSTLRKWRKLVRDALARGWSSLEGLLDEIDNRGFHGSHIDLDFSEQLNEWIKKGIKDEKNPSVLSIYFDIKELAEAHGYKMIAQSSFYERVKKLRTIESIRHSKGDKHAYQLKPTYWMLDGTVPIHCSRALELVHFDSTLLDIEVRSSISGEILGRPWLTLAICAHTRRVVGMHLSFSPPGYVSSMMVLADIIRRFGRVPDAIIHDWGSEFKAKDWKYALTALFITRHVRPKSAARFGGVLERMFGIVTRELLDNIAGNTKLRKDVRSLSPGADPSNHSGLWLVDLHHGLEEFFFAIYDDRKHPTTLMKPRASFEASLLKHGWRPHRLQKLADVLPILMPTARGAPRTIDPARGVWVNHRYFGGTELAHLSLRGRSISIKPLPHDPGSVLAFINGRWLVLRSNLTERLSRLPESFRQCIYEELRLEQQLVTGSKKVSRMRLRELLSSMNKKAEENVEYWKDPELRSLLKLATFEDDSDSEKHLPAPNSQSAVSRLDAQMLRALNAFAGN